MTRGERIVTRVLLGAAWVLVACLAAWLLWDALT